MAVAHVYGVVQNVVVVFGKAEDAHMVVVMKIIVKDLDQLDYQEDVVHEI